MTNTTDTPALREAFCAEFMWMSDLDHERMTMAAILDLFDTELGATAQREPEFDAAEQYDEAIEWLAEHGHAIRHGVTRR